MTVPAVQLDFRSDWFGFVREVLTAWGHPPDASDADSAISRRMFNLAKRRVEPGIRQVFESAEFNCPKEHLIGWNALKAKLERGDDVVPHLSTALGRDPDYDDGLLNDWGIHHFHLGMAHHPGVPGFVARTGPLVFGRVTPTQFYAVNVYDHDGWSRKAVIETIWRNWPEVLEPFQLKGVLPGDGTTDEEHGSLRDAGIAVIVQLADGTMLMPPGGGLTTAGTSISVAMESIRHLGHVDVCERWVASNAETIAMKAAEIGKPLAVPLRLRLLINRQGWYALDPLAGVAFKLPV